MKKFLFIILLGLTLLISGCDKKKTVNPVIFYSSEPINLQTFSLKNAETEFKIRQKIYFVFYNPKLFTSSKLRLQVLKIDLKYPSQGVCSIAYGRDIGINTSNKFVTDYFVIHSAGNYILRIFSSDEYFTPLAQAEFKVNDN